MNDRMQDDAFPRDNERHSRRLGARRYDFLVGLVALEMPLRHPGETVCLLRCGCRENSECERENQRADNRTLGTRTGQESAENEEALREDSGK